MRAFYMFTAASMLGLGAAWIALPSSGSAATADAAALQSGSETYAAIAASYSAGRPFHSGTGANASSRAEAAQRALGSCRAAGGNDCTLVLEYRGRACGTYYVSNDGADYAWGWAMEPVGADADRISLAQCQAQLRAGESCNGRVRVCNSRGGTPAVIQGKENLNDEEGDDA